MMIYGYARISSKSQEDGTSLDEQEKVLRERGCTEVYREVFTGTKVDRPVLDDLIGRMQSGDTLMVIKLDRFARTVVEGAKLIQELLDKGISVDVLNMGRLDNTPIGKLMTYMLLAIAEFERDTIMDRLNTGKAAKRRRGEKAEGRNRVQMDEDVFELYVEKQQAGEKTVQECCNELGISRGTWYNRVRESA